MIITASKNKGHGKNKTHPQKLIELRDIISQRKTRLALTKTNTN